VTFKLLKKSSNKARTTFHVMNGTTIHGIINVPPEEEANLLKCWAGQSIAAAAAGQPSTPLARAFAQLRPPGSVAPAAKQGAPPFKLKLPRMTKEAILRGC
jgi:hypothetical protein